MRKTSPAVNDKKKVSPRGKRKLQFIEKQAKLPLSAKSIYLDIKDVRQSRKVEDDLKRLGAVVEKFLSKDINYVISCQARQRQQKDDKFGSADSPAAVSTPSPFNCGPSPGNVDTKASQPSTITRGKAMVNKAKVENKVSSIVENAENWGVKVISLQAALKWIKKEISKLPLTAHQQGKQETKSQQQSSSRSARVKRLKTPYLKFDASSLHYKPVFKQLDTWPHAHVETARGTCPFDGLTVGRGERSREERGDRIGMVPVDVDSLVAEVNEDPTKDSATPFGDKSAQGKNKQSENNHSSIVGGVKLVTAGDIRRRQEKKRNAERKRGYCECCQLKYEDLDKHVRDDQHKAFIRDKNNYKNLDDMIQSGPNTAQFLQRLLIQHCAENKTKNKNSASNNKPNSMKKEEKSKGTLATKQSDKDDSVVSNNQNKNKNKTSAASRIIVIQAPAKSPVTNLQKQPAKSPAKTHQNQERHSNKNNEKQTRERSPAKSHQKQAQEEHSNKNGKQTLEKSPVKNHQKQAQERCSSKSQDKQALGKSPVITLQNRPQQRSSNDKNEKQAQEKSPVKTPQNRPQQRSVNDRNSVKNHHNQAQQRHSNKSHEKALEKSPVKNHQKQIQESPAKTKEKQQEERSPVKLTRNQKQEESPNKTARKHALVESPAKHHQKQVTEVEQSSLQKQKGKNVKTTDFENVNKNIRLELEKMGATSVKLQKLHIETSPKVGEKHTVPQRNRNLDAIMVENMSPRRLSWASDMANNELLDDSRLRSSPRKTKLNNNNVTNVDAQKKNENTTLDSKEHLERLFREKIEQAKIPDSPRRSKMKKENLLTPEKVYIGKNKVVVNRTRSPDKKVASVAILKNSPSRSQRTEKLDIDQENKVVNLENYCVKKSPCFKKSPMQKNSYKNHENIPEKMQCSDEEVKRQRKIKLFEFDDTDEDEKSATSEMQKSITDSPKSGISNTPGSNKRRKRWRVKKSKDENKPKSESKEKLKRLQKLKLPVNEKPDEIQNGTDKVHNVKRNSDKGLQKDETNTKHSQSKNRSVNNENVIESPERGISSQIQIKEKQVVQNGLNQTNSVSVVKENVKSTNSGSTNKRNGKVKIETSSQVSVSTGVKICVQLGAETVVPQMDMYSRAKLGRRNKNSSPAIITLDSNFVTATNPTCGRSSDIVVTKVTKESKSRIEKSKNVVTKVTKENKSRIEESENVKVKNSEQQIVCNVHDSRVKDSGIDSSKRDSQDKDDSFSLKWQNASILDSEKKPRKVKLDRSWNLISDRSALKILGGSERDEDDSFEGFQPNDVAETELGTDVSYVETTEIELDENSNQEWTIDHESEEVEDLLPTLFSSPGKRSDSSWGDACDDYIQSQLTCLNKYSFRIGPSPVLSPRRRVNTTPSKRKIVECEGNETFEVTPKKRKFGRNTFEHNMLNCESGVEKVDSEITFNHCSPQKGFGNKASPGSEKRSNSLKIHTSTPFRFSPSRNSSKHSNTKRDQSETSKNNCDTSNQGRRRSLKKMEIDDDHVSPIKKSKSRRSRNR